MSENSAEIKFGGDASGASAAAAEAARAVKEAVTGMQASLGTLGSTFSSLTGMFAGLTAALAGGHMFKEVLSASAEWNSEVVKLSKTLGITTESASVLAVALDHIGVSSATYSQAAVAMTRQLTNNSQAFLTLGVATRDVNGQLRPTTDIMADVNSKLKEIHNGTLLNQAGMQAYGRSWNEVRGILKLNADQMEEARSTAERLHLIVGPEGAAMTRQYKESQRDLSLVLKSLEIQIGNQVLPAFTQLGKFMGEEGPALAEFFGNAMKAVSESLSMIWLSTQKAGLGIAYLGNQIEAATSGNWGAMSRLAQGYGRDLDAIEAKYKKLNSETWNPPAPKQSKPEDVQSPNYDFSKGGNGSDQRMQQWKAELEAKREAEENFFKSSLNEEEQFWQTKLASIKGNAAQDLNLRRQIQHEIYQLHKQQATDLRALEAERIESNKAIDLQELELKRANLAQQEAMGKISKEEELIQLRQLKDDEYQIEMQALEQKVALMSKEDAARQKLLDQIALARGKHNTEMVQQDTAIFNEQKSMVERALSPITNAIQTSVTGIIMGTTTMKKALSNIFQSIMGEFVSFVTKKTVTWLAGEVALTGITRMWSGIRQALGFTEAATTVATKTTEATAVVGANAAEAASGAAASQASIPYVGPVMAAAAFAAMAGLVMGAKSMFSAKGGFDVPSGTNPVTQLHEREMVLPAEYADAIRGMAGSGAGSTGSGGVTVNINAAYADARGIEKMFMAHGNSLVRSLRNQERLFSGVGREK